MRIDKEQILKFDRKFNRDEELRGSTGWVCKHKVHPSKKSYNRKNQSKI